MSHDVFVYGSLLFDDIFAAVTGAPAPRVGAVLDDHARYRLKGESYPAIVPEPGVRTIGAVYRSVSDRMLDRLDRFEGKEYLRARVRVLLDSGTALVAHAYVLDPAEHARLEPVAWDPDAFEREHRAQFARLHPVRER